MLRIFNNSSSQKGQTLLIVILIMVVVLTIGLGAAARSITNLHITSEETNSQKAFSAAEAGIEEVLKTGVTPAQSETIGSATLSKVTVLPLSAITNTKNILVNNGNKIAQDDGVDIWMTNYNTNPANLYLPPYWNGNLSIYWGTAGDACTTDPATNTMAALSVFIITANPDKNSPKTSKYAFDPCGSRKAANGYANPVNNGTYTLTTSNGPVKFAHQANIPWAGGPVSNGLIMRITPIYAGTVLWVQGDHDFPSQGQIITATGTSGTTSRQISFFQGFDAVPSEFFYSIFSPN